MATKNYGLGINWAPQSDFGVKQNKLTNQNTNAVNTTNTTATTPVTKTPVMDFSQYKFGSDATPIASQDKNYFDMRNLGIAAQLSKWGITTQEGVMSALKDLPWFAKASDADKQNTINNIFSYISSGRAADPVYQNIADKYNMFAATNPSVANKFTAVANDYGQISDSQNQVLDFFRNYESAMNPYLNNYIDANSRISQDILWQLNTNKDTFMSQYWPEWEQRKRMQDYYNSIADVLASEQSATANEIDAQARQAGASLWATRAARNKALGTNLKLATDYKAKEVADYDNLYKTVNAYLSEFTKLYWWTQDAYVKDTYAKLLEFKNGLASALTNAQAQFEQLKVQEALQQAAKTGISLRR